MAAASSVNASPDSAASSQLLVKTMACKAQIIAAIEHLALTQTATRGGPLCRVCAGALGEEPIRTCPVCGWSCAQRCVEKTKRKYLIALACCAAWGVWAIPVIRFLRFSPTLTIHILSHLTQHWEQATHISAVVVPILTDVVAIPPSSPWPTQEWPLTGKRSLFTENPSARLVALFHKVESMAWDAFRKARWGGTAKWREVHCPFCDTPAVAWGKRHLGQQQKQFIMRWWCRNASQRNVCNARQRSHYQRRKPIRRKGKIRRTKGCGKRFSDLTGTPFYRRQAPMSEWMMLITGGPLAIPVLRAAGISAVRCLEMVAALCTVAETAPEFMGNLITWSSSPLLEVLGQLYKRGE